MITTIEKDLILQLLTHKRIRIYDFYLSKKYSTGLIIKTLLKFQRQGLLIIIGRSLYRTPWGYNRLNKKRVSILSNTNRYWRKIPNEMKGNTIGINEVFPYITLPDKHRMVSKSEM